MPILNQNVLGKLSGKLGNLVFRQINGKTYVSNRPEKYNSTQSFKAANVRNGFKQINLFASSINKDPILKSIWGKSQIDARNSYTKILKANLEISPRHGINESNIIVPNNNLILQNTIIVKNNLLEIRFNKKQIEEYLSLEQELQCYLLVFSSQPNNNNANPFIARIFNSLNFNDNFYELIFSFIDETNYKFKINLFFVTLILKEGHNILNWTSTTSSKVMLEP
ncbi:MAG: hypothetical protein WAR79_06715 [Melioribacteraceae bacterium]